MLLDFENRNKTTGLMVLVYAIVHHSMAISGDGTLRLKKSRVVQDLAISQYCSDEIP